MLIYVVSKIVYKLWQNCNIYGNNIEHNRQLFEYLILKSIIVKKLSVIGRG